MKFINIAHDNQYIV